MVLLLGIHAMYAGHNDARGRQWIHSGFLNRGLHTIDQMCWSPSQGGLVVMFEVAVEYQVGLFGE